MCIHGWKFVLVCGERSGWACFWMSVKTMGYVFKGPSVRQMIKAHWLAWCDKVIHSPSSNHTHGLRYYALWFIHFSLPADSLYFQDTAWIAWHMSNYRLLRSAGFRVWLFVVYFQTSISLPKVENPPPPFHFSPLVVYVISSVFYLGSDWNIPFSGWLDQINSNRPLSLWTMVAAAAVVCVGRGERKKSIFCFPQERGKSFSGGRFFVFFS